MGDADKIQEPKCSEFRWITRHWSATVEALLTATAGWDFVVINDYTQGPARSKNCRSSIKALLEGGLAQMIQKAGATPVLVQTWAYREHVKDSEDLGDNLEFTNRLL